MRDPRDESAGDESLDAVIADWLEAIEHNPPPNTEEFVAQHPQHATELRNFIANYQCFHQAIASDHDSQSHGSRLPKTADAPDSIHMDAHTIWSSEVVSGSDRSENETLGAYELLHEIARGGMGIIFKGRDKQLGREIAIKVLRDAEHPEFDLKQRFVEEAQIAGQLQHPGIAPVYELGEFPDQRPYFTMKLVKGETLAKLLSERTSPATDRHRFLKIFENICQTLAYAHSRRVIHRDLKPSNIMVGAFGEVQVMDWGLAKVLSDREKPSARTEIINVSVIRTVRTNQTDDDDGTGSQTQVGSVLGTVAYMPPEQAMGDINEIDQRADVFGLGAILCEILTGQPPYVGATVEQIRRKALRADLDEAFDRLQTCGADDELIDLARRALAREPSDRPPDAGVMSRELGEYLSGVESRLRQAELAEVQALTRATEERHRRRLALALSGAVLVVLAIGIVGTTWGLFRAGRALQAESLAKDDLRRDLYVADLQLANQIWESDNGTAKNVADLLDGHSPPPGQSDLREFAWRLQWTSVNQISRILKGHHRGAKCVAFASDGQLVTLDGESMLRRFRPSHQAPSTELRLVAESFVSCFSISADARWVAIGTGEHVRLFDALTGRNLFQFPGATLASGLSFTRDGKYLAIAWADGRVEIRDVGTGQDSATFRADHPDAVAGLERIALNSDASRVFLTDYPDTKQAACLSAAGESYIATDHKSSVYSVALHPDGQMGASGDSNGQICFWDTRTLERLGTGLKVHRGEVSALEFSNDGRRLAAGAIDGVVSIWDVASREQILRFKGHRDRVNSLCFSSDDIALASASDDGRTRVWSLGPVTSAPTLRTQELPVFSVAFSPDGQRIAVGTGSESKSPGGVVNVWDVPSGKLVASFRAAEGRVLTLAFVPDAADSTRSTRLITGGYDGNVRVWQVPQDHDSAIEVGEPRILGSAFPRSAQPQNTVIGALAVSRDAAIVAGGFGNPLFHRSDYKQVVKIWDLATGVELATLHGHANTVCSLAFSPSGKLLATASDDHRVKLWKVNDWKRPIRTLEGTDRFTSVTFSPDGKWVAAGDARGTITIWNSINGVVLNQLRGHANVISGLAFSPDSRTLASASWDNTIKLWEPLSGRETRTLRDHQEWISCVAFAPDGNSMATGSFDATVRMWNAASRQSIANDVAEDLALAKLDELRRQEESERRSRRKSVLLTAIQLAGYAGTYENGMTIAEAADHLTIQPIEGEGGAAVELFPESESIFFARNLDLDLKFVTATNGQVVRVLICLNGRTLETRRTTSLMVDPIP